MTIPPRHKASRSVPVVAAVAGLALTPAAAYAKAPSCPTTGTQKTVVTWGGPSADRPLSEVSVHSGIALTGLAADGERHPPTIRTRRDRAGRGHPVLCAAGRVRVSLPVLERGQAIEAASVNGGVVVWRLAASRTRDTVVRASVRNARLHDVRRLTIRVADRSSAVDDHRIVAAANGTVAWALDAKAGDGLEARIWVWPRARRAATALRSTGTQETLNIRVLDDQNVLTNDSRVPLRYAQPTPGKCPVLVDAAPKRDLGGWLVADVRGWTQSDDAASQGESWNVVCDPASGRYVDIVGNSAGATPGGDAGSRSTTHIIRGGDWVLSSQHGEGNLHGDRVLVANASSKRHYAATGRAEGPGIDHTGEDHASPPSTGAVVGPGYVAFIATDDDSSVRTQRLMLSDAAGTVTVATGDAGAPLGGLTTDGTTLTWTTATGSHSAPISPAPASPYAVVEPQANDPF